MRLSAAATVIGVGEEYRGASALISIHNGFLRGMAMIFEEIRKTACLPRLPALCRAAVAGR
jgi:hypothetical protein